MSQVNPKSNDIHELPLSAHSSASHRRGYLFILVAVTFWGGSASLAKYLFATRFDAMIISQMRVSLLFLVLAGFFLLKNRSIFIIDRKDTVWFVLLGIIGVAMTNFAYYFTVQESTVATAILIQYTAPVLVMIYAVAISKEEAFNGMKVISLVLSLVGCFFAVSGGAVSEIKLRGWALVTGPAAALCYAYMLVAGPPKCKARLRAEALRRASTSARAGKKVLRKYSVWTMLTYAFGVATLFWLVVNPPWLIAAKAYTASDWGIFWIFAIVSILIPHATFSAGLKILEASSVGIASTLEPIIAIAIAYVALNETLNAVQIAGAAAVVFGVLVLQVASYRKILRRAIP